MGRAPVRAPGKPPSRPRPHPVACRADPPRGISSARGPHRRDGPRPGLRAARCRM